MPPTRSLTWLVGTVFDGSIEDIDQRHRHYAACNRSHGPVFAQFRVLCSRVVFVGRIDLLPTWYIKGESDRGDLKCVAPQCLLGLKMGEQWATHRKLIAPLFSIASIDSYLPTIHAASAALCNLWREHGADAKELEAHADLSAWSLDIFGRVACAHDFEALAQCRAATTSPYTTGARAITSELVRRFVFGPLAKLSRAKMRKFDWACQLYRSVAEDIFDRVRSEHGSKGGAEPAAAAAAAAAPAGARPARDCLASKLAKLALGEGGEDGRLSRQEVVDEVLGLLLAGHETSSNTATWALHLLAQNQEAQDKVRAEVAGLDLSSLSLRGLHGCELLVGCMYEALRLHAAVPLVPKRFEEAKTIGGHSIPAGTRIVQNKLAMGEDPEYFPNPELFDPARFGRGEYGPQGARILAFGAGPRMCVGVRLAEAEVLSVIGHVLQSFRVRPGSVAPVEMLSITLQPKHGMRLVFEPLPR